MKIGVPEGDGGGGGGGAPMHETRGGAGTDPTTAGTQDGEEEPSHESQLRSLLESPESCGSGPAAASASPCTCELAGGPWSETLPLTWLSMGATVEGAGLATTPSAVDLAASTTGRLSATTITSESSDDEDDFESRSMAARGRFSPGIAASEVRLYR